MLFVDSRDRDQIRVTAMERFALTNQMMPSLYVEYEENIIEIDYRDTPFTSIFDVVEATTTSI